LRTPALEPLRVQRRVSCRGAVVVAGLRVADSVNEIPEAIACGDLPDTQPGRTDRGRNKTFSNTYATGPHVDPA